MGKPTYVSPGTAYTLGGPSTHEMPPCPKGCGAKLELTPDAIGRLRERCPRCDGKAKPPVIRPGEVRRSQEVEYGRPVERRSSIALPAGVYRLPSIAPGEVRCQRCARGVPPNRRVCKPCIADARSARAAARPKKEKPKKLCPDCGVVELRARSGKYGRPPQRCEACQAKRKLGPLPRCWDCKGGAPRGRKKCDACLAKTAAKKAVRTCSKCGGPVPKWKQICPDCREAKGTIAAPRYRPKPCKRCVTLFTPSGPRSLYCEACR